jgi:hypothetical protein
MTESCSLRWDGGPDEKMAPGQFLREINIKIEDKGYTTDTKKIDCFWNNLDYGGTANIWLDDLPPADKTTWDELVAAFYIEWPKMAVAKASKAERIRALKEWRLELKELCKKTETIGGKEVWMHVKWADGIVAKAKDAEDTGGLLLQDVVDGLAAPVWDLIRHKPRTTYKELADAVREVDVVELRDGVTKHTKDEETARLARMNTASPTRAIRESLANTHLPPDHTPCPYRPQQQTQNNFTDPFHNGGGRGTLFGPGCGNLFTIPRGIGTPTLSVGRGMQPPASPNTLRERPIFQRHQDLLQFAIIQHPNTDTGRAAYQSQIAEWHRTNSGVAPDEQHHYPLTPGTSQLGSRECYDCGQPGHGQGAPSPVCPGQTLPDPEWTWRRIAGYIDREFKKESRAAAAVNYIGYQACLPPNRNQYTYQQYPYTGSLYPGEVEDIPGNGEGPSA